MKQSSIDWIYNNLKSHFEHDGDLLEAVKMSFEQAKAMQQKQAHLYAAFVLKCVQNNLPPITFNDWINLENK